MPVPVAAFQTELASLPYTPCYSRAYPSLPYHDRDFEGLSDNMKETAMLKTLIQEGIVLEGAVDDEIFRE